MPSTSSKPKEHAPGTGQGVVGLDPRFLVFPAKQSGKKVRGKCEFCLEWVVKNYSSVFRKNGDRVHKHFFCSTDCSVNFHYHPETAQGLRMWFARERRLSALDREALEYFWAYYELETLRAEKEEAGKLLDPEAQMPLVGVGAIIEAIREVGLDRDGATSKL